MSRQPSFKITFRYIVKYEDEEPMAEEDITTPPPMPWGTLITAPPSITWTGTPSAICPDLLSIRNLGEADGWRGSAVRAFFELLWWVTGV